MKKAFITGITGQDGSYLAEFLLDKGYEVHGTIRRVYDANHPNIKNIKNDVILHQADLTDGFCVGNVLGKVNPDEIYNLAAQSHVGVSFSLPLHTVDVDALGPLRILEAIRSQNLESKLYQASTSEMFGVVNSSDAQNEQTIFQPASPYGCAKLFAHWLVINYRKGYNIFACNGILCNHESPRRGELFVTRKVTKAFANIYKGNQEFVELGNLQTRKDWGHAKDYVRAMWLMLQQDAPDDYVVGTGKQYSLKDFCEKSAQHFDMDLVWEGEGLNEIGINKKTGKTIVKINPKFYRPIDVVDLTCDPKKANEVLGWYPEYSFDDLIKDMCESDYNSI